MTVILESAGTTGYKAIIDKDGRVTTFSTTLPESHHVNQVTEKSWAIPFDAIDPTTSDDYFVYLKNTDAAVRVIDRMAITSTVAGYLEIQEVTGPAGGGQATLTPVSFTVGGPAPVNFTAESDPDITGLTEVGKLHFHWLIAATTAHIEFPQTIRLKQNQAIALNWTVATGILTGSLEMYEEEVD